MITTFIAPQRTEFTEGLTGTATRVTRGSHEPGSVLAPNADLAAFVLSSSPGSLASIAAEEIGAKPGEGLMCSREKCPHWREGEDYEDEMGRGEWVSGGCVKGVAGLPRYCEPVLSRLLALAGAR